MFVPSHAGTQRLRQSGSQEAQALHKWVADLVIMHVVLVLREYRRLRLRGHGGFR